jgi:uncharacterized protein (TIGR03435 family)
MRAFSLLCLVLAQAFAQTAGTEFEVASVKTPARPGGRGTGVLRGGPGSSDPGQITILNMPLRTLIVRAYGLKDYQLTGPGWMEDERWDVIAKVPAGATQADAFLMLQHLLAERFQLTVHREHRDLPGYALTVSKGGSKFRESVPVRADAPADGPSARPFDKDGYPLLTPGTAGTKIDSALYGGDHALTAALQTMNDLATTISRELGKPVIDATGLTGRYDYKMHWITEYVPPPGSARAAFTPEGPDLPAAIQQQLGLKLESRKVPTEILIVDHVEKTPLEK